MFYLSRRTNINVAVALNFRRTGKEEFTHFKKSNNLGFISLYKTKVINFGATKEQWVVMEELFQDEMNLFV